MDDPRVGDGVTVDKARMNGSDSGPTGSHRTGTGSLIEDCGQEVCYLAYRCSQRIHLGSVTRLYRLILEL